MPIALPSDRETKCARISLTALTTKKSRSAKRHTGGLANFHSNEFRAQFVGFAMRKMAGARVLWGAGTAVTLAAFASVALWPKMDGARGPALTATLLSPAPGGDGVLTGASLREIDVTWSVVNAGPSVVSGLRAGVSCQCKVKEALLQTLAPRESARFAARVRAPAAGVSLREVPIFDAEHKEPLLTLAVRIRAVVTAPSWLTAPSMTNAKGIAGRAFQHEQAWEAIETVGEPPWLESVELVQLDGCNVTLASDERPWGEDAKFVLRNYRATISSIEFPVARRSGSLQIRYRSNDGEPRLVPILFEAIPALTVIPATIRLGSTGAAARVVVVRRDSVEDLPKPQFDSSLLDVVCRRAPGGAPMAFEIRPITPPHQTTTTEVLFAADGLEPARLMVQIQAADSESAP
jgi:hypothetical protein